MICKETQQWVRRTGSLFLLALVSILVVFGLTDFLASSAYGQSSSKTTEKTAPDNLMRFEFARPIMGVEFKIALYADSEDSAAAASEKAFAEIQSFDEALSDYKSNSEVKRICNSAPHAQPIEISERLYLSIQHSQAMYEQTNGAFDITIGPASRVWRTARRRNRLPSDEKVNVALKRMGMQHIRLLDCKVDDSDGFDVQQKKCLQLDLADMQLDFGGIAKGFAADRALAILRDAGFDSAFVDASGDIVVGNAPPGEEAWNVEIPSVKGETMTIPLVNGAVATSGDVYQFMEVDGVRYSHLVDPETGRAVTTPRIVTVISDCGMRCDSLASALSVVGQAGLEGISSEGFSVQIIEASNQELTQFDLFRTSSFPQVTENPRSPLMNEEKSKAPPQDDSTGS